MKIKLLAAAALTCLALNGCNKPEASKEEEKKAEHPHVQQEQGQPAPSHEQGTGGHSSLESEGHMAQDVQDMMLASDQPQLSTNTQPAADQTQTQNPNQNTNQPIDPNNPQPAKPQQDPTTVGNDAGAAAQQPQGTTNTAAPFGDEEE